VKSVISNVTFINVMSKVFISKLIIRIVVVSFYKISHNFFQISPLLFDLILPAMPPSRIYLLIVSRKPEFYDQLVFATRLQRAAPRLHFPPRIFVLGPAYSAKRHGFLFFSLSRFQLFFFSRSNYCRVSQFHFFFYRIKYRQYNQVNLKRKESKCF